MKILVAGHDLKFIKFYIDYLDSSEHEVRIDAWENHVSHNIKESFELIRWADVIFCEWGLGNSVFYSKNKRPNQKLIVRLHRQELETTYLTQANIDHIDAFITVSPYIYEEFSRTFNLPRKKISLIYNNVDLEKFTNKNLEEREFHIGMVGYLPTLKRMDLALNIFEELYSEDERYILHFKGKRPEELRWLWRIEEEREFYEEQFHRIEMAEWKDNVVFEPFGDVVDFYNRMEFILSVSDVESFHLSVAEGMACGTIPIITNWEGSDTIYSSDYIVKNINEVPKQIENINRNINKYHEKIKNDIQKFNQELIIVELNDIIFK